MKTKVYLNRVLLITGMLFLLQTGASAEERWIKAEYVKKGAVDTGSSGAQLAVRSGPGADYAQTDRLSVGQKVSAYETKDGWIRISSNEVAISKSAVQERWVNGAYVKKGAVDTGSASATLAVRSGPGMDYGLVGSLPPGQKVTSLETRNGWIRIPESAPAVSAVVPAPIKSVEKPQVKFSEPPQAPAAVVAKPKEVAPRPVAQPAVRPPVVQTVVRPPVDNLVLNGDFSGMALALPFPQGNSTAELSGRWVRSSRSAWEISPNGGNLGFYVCAAASAEPARLLYVAGDDKRSKGQYVLRFDYILTSQSDELGVKVFVSDRDITIGTDGGDFRMNSAQRMSDQVMLPASASWSTYYLPVELGAGYNYVYVLFSGSGTGNTGIDNVSLSPRRR